MKFITDCFVGPRRRALRLVWGCALVLLVAPVFGPAHAAPLVYFTNVSPTIEQVLPDGSVAPFVTSGPGGSRLGDGAGVVVDRAGNLYADFVDEAYIAKVTPSGVVTTINAGLGATPKGLAIDASGNLYASQSIVGDVIKVTPAGVVSIFATGLDHPQNIVAAGDGALYLTNSAGHDIFKLTASGDVSTFATGLTAAADLAVDPTTGNLYVSDYGANQILRVNADGSLSPYLAGVPTPGAMDFDPAGDLFVFDYGDQSLLEFMPGGDRRTVATSGLFNLGALAAPLPEPAAGCGAMLVFGCALNARRAAGRGGVV